MPLTASEAFKVGFLEGCVERGLNLDQIQTAVKRAADLLASFEKVAMRKRAFPGEELLGRALNAGTGLASGVGWFGALAPPILGGAAGYGLARATDIDDTDVSEIKNRELIDEYRRQAARLQRQTAVRDYQRLKQQRPGRVFM